MNATLYVVATPIGNLDDFTPRAVEILRAAGAIYAEDTRRSRILLEHFGIGQAARSLHEHNERARTAEVLTLLAQGQSVALVTDAGTPAVSDPGGELVRSVAEAGYTVSPIPGASALTALLSVAGFPTHGESDVLFVGFLPQKGKEREAALTRICEHSGVVVLFEAPHHVRETLAGLHARQPERACVLGRELTKVHEELRRGTVKQLLEWAESREVRGEMTLALAPFAKEEVSPEEAAIDAALSRCLASGLSARDAATAVAAILELPRRGVYERCQALKDRDS